MNIPKLRSLLAKEGFQLRATSDREMLNRLRLIASRYLLDDWYLGKDDWQDTLSSVTITRKMGGIAIWGPQTSLSIPDDEVAGVRPRSSPRIVPDDFYAWLKKNGAEIKGNMKTVGKPLRGHPGYTILGANIFGPDGIRVGAIRDVGDDYYAYWESKFASKSGKRLSPLDGGRSRATVIKQVIRYHKTGR